MVLRMDGNWCRELELGVKQWNEKTISYHSASLGSCFSLFLSNDVSLLWNFRQEGHQAGNLSFVLTPRNLEICPLYVPLLLGTDMTKIKNQGTRNRMSKHNLHTRANLGVVFRNNYFNLISQKYMYIRVKFILA